MVHLGAWSSQRWLGSDPFDVNWRCVLNDLTLALNCTLSAAWRPLWAGLSLLGLTQEPLLEMEFEICLYLVSCILGFQASDQSPLTSLTFSVKTGTTSSRSPTMP